jgi:hypothetical protein
MLKKKNRRSGRWTGEFTSAPFQAQRLSAVTVREVALARGMISFHPEDVTVINSASHMPWMFLEKKNTLVALED